MPKTCINVSKTNSIDILFHYRHYEKYYTQALKTRRLITDDFANVYSDGIDVLLTPTVLGDAPLYSWFSQADNRTRTMEQDVFTQPINVAGVVTLNIYYCRRKLSKRERHFCGILV